MINENGQGPNSEVINRRNKIISATAAGLGVISLPLLMGLRSRCDSQGESNECNDGIDINEKVAGILAFKSFTLGLRYFRLNEKKILNAINRSDHATSDLESHNSQQLDGQNIQVSELAQSQSASQNSQARETRSMLISMTAASMGVVSFVALIGSRIYCGTLADREECSRVVNENFATALAINTAIIGARYFYNNTRGILSELRESFNADNVSDNVPDQVRAELVVAQASQSIEPLSSEPVTGVTRDQARGDN
jgi:hypothetical protein